MKKNILLGALSVPLFLIAGFFWLLSSLPDQAIDYINGGADPIVLMAKLRFRDIIDAPGFVGIPGSPTAKGDASDAIRDEQRLWGKMSTIEMRLTYKQYLTQCVEKLNDQRLEFYAHIESLPDDGLMKLSDGKQLIKQEKALINMSVLCHGLAVRAQKWRERLLAKVTGSSIVEDELYMPEQAKVGLAAADDAYLGLDARTRIAPAHDAASEPVNATAAPTMPVASTVPVADPAVPPDACKVELKQFIVAQVGKYTAANETAVTENCRDRRKEWMCFLDKAKMGSGFEGYAGLSLADEGNFKHDCGLTP